MQPERGSQVVLLLVHYPIGVYLLPGDGAGDFDIDFGW